MKEFSCIEKCKCNSILEVESEDINADAYVLDNKLKYYFNYYCPICYSKNYLIESKLPKYLILEKLVKLKISL